MPARVEYRLGSIFDEECDFLVIPTWSNGKVSPGIAEALQKFGIPFPPALSPSELEVLESPNPGFAFIAYAGVMRNVTFWGDDELVSNIATQIGAQLGELPPTTPTFIFGGERSKKTRDPIKISISLPDFGAGRLSPAESAAALERGFLKTAPDSALLMISVEHNNVLQALLRETQQPTRHGSSDLFRPAGKDPRWPSRRGGGRGVSVPTVLSSDAPLERRGSSNHPPAPAANPSRTRVFISYSYADAEWLERLQKHLRPLEREGAMVWADTRIKAGAEWREEIRLALTETKVAILLISADFMASEFIVTNELPPLLKAAEEEGATILPVIISASSFLRTPSLSRFQAVNNPDKPLVQLRKANREKVLDDVARAVEDALKK